MSELLMLDVRTLAFASAISGFLMALTMSGIYLAGMRSRALVDWAVAGSAFGVGYLLGHLLQTIPVPLPTWLVLSAANALIGLGHGFILIGVQRYLGRPVWLRTVLVIVVLLFLSGFALPAAADSLRFRVIMHSSWYVLIATWSGYLLWQAHRPGMQRFHRGAAVILLAFAAFLALRVAYAAISPALTTSFVQDPFQIGAFLAAMVYGFCLTMALAVMLFREKQLELLLQARRDPLTGMRNRLSLQEHAEIEMLRASRNRQALSIILFDLDYFKQINDRHGHQAGDAALKAVAECIRSVMRSSDMAFRFGGEEFLVLLPGAAASQAAAVAERFRTELAQIEVELEACTLKLTASFGVVEWRAGEESWDHLVRRADQALYQAKHGGRDQVIAPIQVGLAAMLAS
jgi:diguanylate cyclase (GGDEF)-like protein